MLAILIAFQKGSLYNSIYSQLYLDRFHIFLKEANHKWIMRHLYFTRNAAFFRVTRCALCLLSFHFEGGNRLMIQLKENFHEVKLFLIMIQVNIYLTNLIL